MDTLTYIKKEDLFIQATKYYPEVSFKLTGELKITGRLINDHLENFFAPLVKWVKNMEVKSINLDLNLEYLNTSGVSNLNRLIKTIENNTSVSEIIINWHYEEDDEGHLELGEMIQQKRNRSIFRFIPYENLEISR